MAHVGRIWKLQFRRDLWIEGANFRSWPECFNLSHTGFEGFIGTLCPRTGVQCINLRKNNQPPMVWTSAVLSSGGQDWQFELTVPNPLQLPEISSNILIEIFLNGAIAPAVSAIPSSMVHSMPGTVGGQAFPNDMDMATGISSTFGVIFTFNAARWDTYRPV